jgi:hypothetical protein
LLTHCGLGYPFIFDHQAWLPVDRRLRRTVNPPEGFASDGYYDNGTIRRIDEDTLMYTSSNWDRGGVRTHQQATARL